MEFVLRDLTQEICSKALQSNSWIHIAFDKINVLRLKLKLKDSKLKFTCEKWTLWGRLEEIGSKKLQSSLWVRDTFQKRDTLRLNFGKLWINFTNIRLKKFGRKRFKVVFKCWLLSRKNHFETEFKLWEVEIGIESRMMNYCCHHSIEEIWSKALQSCFKCSLLWRKKPLWDRISTSRGWNWNRIEDEELMLPSFDWRNLVKSASKLFLSAHCFRESSHFETEFKLREVEIEIKSRMKN